MTKDRRLGRGLAALLGSPLDSSFPDTEPGRADLTPAVDGVFAHHRPVAPGIEPPASLPDHDGPEMQGGELMLNVYEIDDNPFQPRRDFSEPEIGSLAESLKEHDMLQPILVRRHGDRYQLISGERRLRAAIRAGWSQVPVRIREANDRLVAELAIVENLQRQDLNAIEKALSFKRYIEQHACTQEDLARRIKIDRSTIANLMRLLELPEVVQQAIGNGTLTAGHAKALLPLGDDKEQIEFCERIQREGMSVREVERIVGEKIQDEEDRDRAVAGSTVATRRRTSSEQLASLETELRLALGTKVEIRQLTKGNGRMIIHFANSAEFERLRATMSELARPQPRSHAG